MDAIQDGPSDPPQRDPTERARRAAASSSSRVRSSRPSTRSGARGARGGRRRTGTTGAVAQPAASPAPSPLAAALSQSRRDLADILARVRTGDGKASDELFAALYETLRAYARNAMKRQSPGHTLQPTALVNEVFLKLVHRTGGWDGRRHFLAVAARAMRSVLVDHARTRTRRKRTAVGRRVRLDDAVTAFGQHAVDLLAIDEALDRLAKRHPRVAQVVELRFFGGLSPEETSQATGVPLRTVERDWRFAKTWLHAELFSEE